MPEYPEEIQDTAEDLYVVDGLTYDQVSLATGVSVSQLKRWGRDRSWKDARKEHRENQRAIRRNQVKLRANLLKKAVDTSDPQAVYAYAAIEKALAVGKKAAPAEPGPGAEQIREISTPKEAVTALKEAVEMKLNLLLSQPSALQLSQIREMKEALALVETMEKAEQGKGKGKITSVDDLPEDTKRTIRDLYGLK